MPSILSVISLIAVLSTAAFVFALVVVPSGESVSLPSTKKRYKASFLRWNIFVVEEAIMTGEEKFPSLLDVEEKPSKEDNLLMQRFDALPDAMPDIT